MDYALKQGNSGICSALLKHSNSNFSLDILEYCSPEKCCLRKEREKYYLDLFKEKKKYNISLDPTAPMSGRTHSEETKKIISENNKGENNPNYGKTGENNPWFGQNHSDEALRRYRMLRKEKIILTLEKLLAKKL
jgi:group I intron endonuclease